jgi:hypothetical protein
MNGPVRRGRGPECRARSLRSRRVAVDTSGIAYQGVIRLTSLNYDSGSQFALLKKRIGRQSLGHLGRLKSMTPQLALPATDPDNHTPVARGHAAPSS